MIGGRARRRGARQRILSGGFPRSPVHLSLVLSSHATGRPIAAVGTERTAILRRRPIPNPAHCSVGEGACDNLHRTRFSMSSTAGSGTGSPGMKVMVGAVCPEAMPRPPTISPRLANLHACLISDLFPICPVHTILYGHILARL